MKEEIVQNIQNPKQLEKLYRSDKITFKKTFNLIYESIQESDAAKFWNERLNFEDEGIVWGTKKELTFVMAASIIAWVIAKIPEITGINEEFFYSRNIGFIVFPTLAAYFIWKQQIKLQKILAIAVVITASIVYINLLPNSTKSDSILLACIHLPFFLWTIVGFTFMGNQLKNNQRRIDYLRYNGDLIVMTTIILIAGILLTLVTLGLFNLIAIKMEEFYFKYIVVGGLAASPIVGTYLIQTNPQLVNKVSPVITKVFTPLVLATLVIYLVAVIATGKDPYTNRDFLIIFNMLLIGVMAIIFFSIAETFKASNNIISAWLLFLLAIVTVVVNGIALSAILFRISEWGITPNRLAVLGGNILILTNLLMVTYQLFKTITNTKETKNVENSIAIFLPIYSLWTMIVLFVFPIVFGFK